MSDEPTLNPEPRFPTPGQDASYAPKRQAQPEPGLTARSDRPALAQPTPPAASSFASAPIPNPAPSQDAPASSPVAGFSPIAGASHASAGDAAPAPTESPEVAERPHPLTPVAKSWISFVILAGIIVSNVDDFRDIDFSKVSQWWWVPLVVVLAVALIALLVGYIEWRTTRFVINDEQLRIERNFISKKSERVAFTKIQSVDVQQPLIARLLGLAAVHIDVGSSGNAPKIEFLARKRAYEIRDYLLHRASGAKTTVAESTQVPVGNAFHDWSATDRQIVVVPPKRLILSIIASSWTVLLLLVVVGIGAATVITKGWGFLGGSFAFLLGMGFGLVQHVWGRFHKEWNFSLLTTSTGSLRSSAGLTSLISQTVPRERVQAIKVTSPLFWRPFGWHRVQLDMVGLKIDSDGITDGFLLPVGTSEEVNQVIDALWPGFRLDAVPHNPSPAATRKVRWFDGHRIWWGRTADVLVAHHGWLTRTTSIVPHARVQSVRLHQGWLQRRLGLASVQAHTTPGPVTVVARHLRADQARELAMGELDMMRYAREHGASWLAIPGSSPEPQGIATEQLLGEPSLTDSATQLSAAAQEPQTSYPDHRVD